MSNLTRIVGLIVLGITEILLVVAFFFIDKGAVLGFQIAVLSLVWGGVAYKNHIDLKRELSSVPAKARRAS